MAGLDPTPLHFRRASPSSGKRNRHDAADRGDSCTGGSTRGSSVNRRAGWLAGRPPGSADRPGIWPDGRGTQPRLDGSLTRGSSGDVTRHARATFYALVGESPVAYLSRWRMHVAAMLLRSPSLSVSEVAGRSATSPRPRSAEPLAKVLGVAPVATAGRTARSHRLGSTGARTRAWRRFIRWCSKPHSLARRELQRNCEPEYEPSLVFLAGEAKSAATRSIGSSP
jgi:hypothetical protein